MSDLEEKKGYVEHIRLQGFDHLADMIDELIDEVERKSRGFRVEYSEGKSDYDVDMVFIDLGDFEEDRPEHHYPVEDPMNSNIILFHDEDGRLLAIEVYHADKHLHESLIESAREDE